MAAAATRWQVSTQRGNLTRLLILVGCVCLTCRDGLEDGGSRFDGIISVFPLFCFLNHTKPLQPCDDRNLIEPD